MFTSFYIQHLNFYLSVILPVLTALLTICLIFMGKEVVLFTKELWSYTRCKKWYHKFYNKHIAKHFD